MTTPIWTDIHAHLDLIEDELDLSPESVVKEAQSVGVHRIITIGTEPKDHDYVLRVSEALFPSISCTLGFHPHYANQWTDESGVEMEKALNHKFVVAVGEIGLDYFYNHSPQDIQKITFRKQMEVAKRNQLPIQVHTRDAEKDTYEILKEYKGSVKGVIHCYTGTMNFARQCLDLGYHLSFSGVVTFKKANELREVCSFAPLDRIHVETDAPFLTPVPKRGVKNTPSYVVHTAATVAQIKNVSLEVLSQCTTENVRHIFHKMIL